MKRRHFQNGAAFSLMELLTVIVVVAILATMVVGISKDILARADRARCTANLKNLYAGAAVYIQDYGHWPQVDTQLLEKDRDAYYQAWIDALEPAGISQINWLCPTVQRTLDDPDMSKPENARIDYLATPFDDRPNTPYLWPKQPWFVERGAVHDGGNLIIYANGQIVTLTEAFKFR